MATGPVHDSFNLLLGALISGLLLGLGGGVGELLTFNGGWFVATFVFSPDADLGPKRRTHLFGLVLYPYSLFFKHRGRSHALIWGTLTRVLYLLLCSWGLIHLTHRLGYHSLDAQSYGQALLDYFSSYDYGIYHYRLLTWMVLGMVGADICHIFLDHFVSFWRKINPFR